MVISSGLRARRHPPPDPRKLSTTPALDRAPRCCWRNREMARVLVIDDDPDVLLLCRVNLAHAGHEVFMALDAERGLEIVRDKQPDIIVLDLMMPNRDGFDVMKELTADGVMQDVPVLVL